MIKEVDPHFEVEIERDEMTSLDYLNITDDLAIQYTGTSYNPVHSTLNQFLDYLRELMEILQEDKAHKVILLDDFSKENIFTDPRNPKTQVLAVVTCSVRGQKPGVFHQTNQPMTSGGVREIRPSLRAIEQLDAEDKALVNYYYSQLFDNEVCFHIHARSNKEANDVVAWFQNVLMMHKKFFALKGIIRYYFLEREADSVVKEGDNAIYVRPLTYYLTTEETYVTTEYTLQKIKLKLKTT
jgi:hypothetical protein